MPPRPAFLHRIPDVIGRLRASTFVHDTVDAEILKRCLFLGAGDAARLLEEVRRQVGIHTGEAIPRSALLDLWRRRIEEASEQKLGRTIDAETLGRVLGVGAKAAARALRRQGLRSSGTSYVITPGALWQHLEESFQDELEVLTVGDVARLLEISRRGATNLVREAGGTLHGSSLLIGREELMRHLVALYQAHGGHERFGETREVLDGRIGERLQIASEVAAPLRPPVETVETHEGEVVFRVGSVAELLATFRKFAQDLRDPAVRQKIDAQLGGVA